MMICSKLGNYVPPTPENMAAPTSKMAETSGLESAMAAHAHGTARRMEVKKTTFRPPTSGTMNEFGNRKTPPARPALEPIT